MTIPAYAISADSLTAETFRQAPSSLIGGAGVVGTGDLAVSQNGTPNMSVDVAPGQVWVPGTLSSTTGFPTNETAQTGYGLPSSFNEQGCYYFWLSTSTNLTIAASDPSNPRIDLVVAAIQDAEYSGASNQAVLQVITGTPAASPSAPTVPASCVVLAQVAVAAGASSIVTADITDERPSLTLAGSGIIGNPAGRMYLSSNVTVASSATDQLTPMTSSFVKGGVTVASNQLTVPKAGDYLIVAFAQCSPGTSVSTQIETNVVKNGGAPVITGFGFANVAGYAVSFIATDIVSLAANDALTMSVYNNGSGSLTVNSGALASYLSVALVSG